MTVEQYERLTNQPHVAVTDLSPRESECGVCGVPLVGCRTGIPFFEGEPVPHDWQGDWVGRDACPKCFADYEATQANGEHEPTPGCAPWWSSLRPRAVRQWSFGSPALAHARRSPISFDAFCDDLQVTDEEREALVHHLAAMRHRETLTLIDGPIARAAKAAAAKRRRTKSETLNETNRAGGRPSYHGSRLHQRLQAEARAEADLANVEMTNAHERRKET